MDLQYVVIIEILIGIVWAEVWKTSGDPVSVFQSMPEIVREAMVNGDSIRITLSPRVV